MNEFEIYFKEHKLSYFPLKRIRLNLCSNCTLYYIEKMDTFSNSFTLTKQEGTSQGTKIHETSYWLIKLVYCNVLEVSVCALKCYTT